MTPAALFGSLIGMAGPSTGSGPTASGPFRNLPPRGPATPGGGTNPLPITRYGMGPQRSFFPTFEHVTKPFTPPPPDSGVTAEMQGRFDHGGTAGGGGPSLSQGPAEFGDEAGKSATATTSTTSTNSLADFGKAALSAVNPAVAAVNGIANATISGKNAAPSLGLFGGLFDGLFGGPTTAAPAPAPAPAIGDPTDVGHNDGVGGAGVGNSTGGGAGSSTGTGTDGSGGSGVGGHGAGGTGAAGGASGGDGTGGEGGADRYRGGPITRQSITGGDPPGPDDGYQQAEVGEYYIRKEAVQRYGRPVLKAINEGRISTAELKKLIKGRTGPSFRKTGASGRAEGGPVTAESLASRTAEGRPIVDNGDGTFSSERSITIQHDQINGGRATNIPTMFGGVELSEDEAIRRIIAAGGRDPETHRALPGFNSIAEAVAAAQARSNALGGAPAVPPPPTEDLREPAPKPAPAPRLNPVRDPSLERLRRHFGNGR